MLNKQDKAFWILTSIFSLAVFILNANHLSQAYVYSDVILPLARSVLNGTGYSDAAGNPAFYPLWGYPILQIPGLIFSNPEIFTLIIQYFLTISGIYYFYKAFEVKPSLFHILLFLPFIAIMSVKVPDAVVGYLIMPYVYYQKKYLMEQKLKWVVVAGILLGAGANFRSEYLFLPILNAAFLLTFTSDNKKNILLSNAVVMIIVLLMLVPWTMRSYVETGDMRFTATNGGAVAYISLGQLKGNQWNIAPFDSTAFSVAKAAGIDNPYSVRGDRFFKSELRKLISNDPLEFTKKCLSNASQIFYRGVYTGEFANLFISQNRRIEINNYLLSKGGMVRQLTALKDLPPVESLPILSEKLIQFLFMPILAFLLLSLIIKCFNFKFLTNPFHLLIISLIFYRILTIAAIQYEYRHVNSFYLPLLGLVLANSGQLGDWVRRKCRNIFSSGL